MTRKQLMRAIALATGVSFASTGFSQEGPGTGSPTVDANPQGFARSENPFAAGGPLNPGRGNPFNAY